ncbi:MAG: helix-turn-helix transcriptional regulator [Candidatus Cryptobacteroides sp.]
MAGKNQLLRYSRIVNKLSGRQEFVTKDELLSAASGSMGEDEVSLRTLQRDFIEINSLFNIEIGYCRDRGYHIKDRFLDGETFERLLSDFSILSAIGSDSILKEYVIPEHRRMAFSVDIGDLMMAVKNRQTVEFSYYLPRKDKVANFRVNPHFLKESQQRWYLVGFLEDGSMRCFEMGRFRSLKITKDSFVRNESVDIPSLFRDSFGIWNNPGDPVEEIILKYDALDARFIKTLPIHSSQKTIEETEDGIIISLHLRITNDFVMELLSRSRSVEVIAPKYLRERLNRIYAEALERNSI